MTKIIRTPTSAKGGITPEEKKLMEAHTQMWINRAMTTERIQPDKIIPAIKGLYRVSDLQEPEVRIVPSPPVMSVTFGVGVAVWNCTKDITQTMAAIDTMIDQCAAVAGTAVDNDDLITGYRTACEKCGRQEALKEAKNWWDCYQGGNMRVSHDGYITACRDILGLRLPIYEKYKFWEECAIYGGFRVLHEQFCLVSDFPELLETDADDRPHSENGPSHRWRDGWSLYFWHGQPVPAHWLDDRENLDPAEVIATKDVEQRAAGCAIVGFAKLVDKLHRKIIEGDPNTDVGALIELTLPGLRKPGRFLQAICPRNGTIVEGVPRVSPYDNLPIKTAIACHAYRQRLPQSEYKHPPYRT